MSEQELPPWLKEQISRLQQLQQNLLESRQDSADRILNVDHPRKSIEEQREKFQEKNKEQQR